MRIPKLGKLSRGASMLLGFAIAALLIPSVALAATTLVTIANSTHTHTAGVTAASQLQVAPAGPAAEVAAFGAASCSAGGIYQIPAGKALIITGVDFFNHASSAGVHELDVYVGPAAAPCGSLVAAGIQTDADVSQNQVFQPGIPVPAGDAVGLAGSNEIGSAAVYGYLVPAAAVPATALQNLPKAPRGRPATVFNGG